MDGAICGVRDRKLEDDMDFRIFGDWAVSRPGFQ